MIDDRIRRHRFGPGEPAPDFVLPAGNREGAVALADYRGKAPVLLAMMRGLYCAFCRRHIAQLGTTRQKLQALGVEVLAIVAMQPERLRLYYRFRPVGVPLAADPDLVTHRAYGVPQPALTPEITQAVASKYLELARDLQIPTTDQAEIRRVLGERDGFEPVPAELKDRRDWSDRHGAQLTASFWSIGTASSAGSISRGRPKVWPAWRSSRPMTNSWLQRGEWSPDPHILLLR